MVLIHSRIERDRCYNTGKSVEGKNGSHFVCPQTLSILSRLTFFPLNQLRVGKCKVILSNVQRAFHLHFMVSGAILKLEWEFVHATVGPEQTKSSLKRAARLFCISKVLLLEFVLGEYYTEMGVADLPIRRSCGSQDRH